MKIITITCVALMMSATFLLGAELLTEGKADLWDSGKVESYRSIHLEYGGKPLESRSDCHW